MFLKTRGIYNEVASLIVKKINKRGILRQPSGIGVL